VNSGLPGMHPDRLIRLMREAIGRCDLNLGGLTVLTEAATGAYVVTPLIAAMADADRVFAITKDSRFGSAHDAALETCELARRLGVERRIELIGNASPEILQVTDILTNSGHVRPITAATISHLKSTAVVPLMYENWEFRSSDLDLEACRKRGIRVGGTNERHEAIGVFNFLGVMAIKLLLEAGVSVYGSEILVLCDNAFGPYLERGLDSAGASVQACSHVPERLRPLDAVLIAHTPREGAVLTPDEMQRIAQHCSGAVIAQFFGDLDRSTLRDLGLRVWPQEEPLKGHMGILPSAVGPEPIVRLQTGGLKAGEALQRGRFASTHPESEFVQLL
jgi:hypothetical protein